MKKKVKFTVYDAGQLAKAEMLLDLLDPSIRALVEHIEINDDDVLKTIKPLQCIMRPPSENPYVVLPSNPLRINVSDDHALVLYDEFSFTIFFGTQAKRLSYTFVVCKGLEKFKM